MNAPKSVDYREAVARIIDPAAFERAAIIDRYRPELAELGDQTAQALAKADAILTLSGPVSGMDTRPSNANPASSLHGEPTEAEPSAAFQARVLPWMLECFGPVIPFDGEERGDRLLEEVFELLQSGGYDPARVLALRDYVWSRDVGEPAQEAGGVMVTMAAYCIAFGLDMAAAGETELARIWTKVPQIRAKQAAKPTGSALPIAKAEATATEAQHAGQWRPIESAPRASKGGGPVEPWLLTDGTIRVLGGRSWACTGEQTESDFWHTQEGSGWNPAFKFVPTHWQPLPSPPAAPPSSAPPSSEREGSRAGDRCLDAERKAP